MPLAPGPMAALAVPLFILMCVWLFSPGDPATSTIPARLEIVATIATGFRGCEQHAEASGNVLCLTDGSSLVNFYRLSNAVPTWMVSVNVPATTKAVAHFNQYFYLSGDGWLRTFSFTEHLSMATNSEVLISSNQFCRLKVRDGHLFAMATTKGRIRQGHVYIFSLADPAAPGLVSTVSGQPGSGFADIELEGTVLYVCDYSGGKIQAFDISDIQRPRLIHVQAVADHGDYARFEPWRMLIKNDALYVQDDDTWQIFNISTPTNPVFVTAFQVEKDIESSCLVGELLMWTASGVNEGRSGVLVYDCTDAFHPVLVGRTDFGVFTGFYWGAMDENFIYQPLEAALHVLSRPRLPASASSPVPHAPRQSGSR